MPEKTLEENLLHDSRIVYWLVRFGLKDVNESIIKFITDFLITSVRLGVMLTLYYALFEYKGETIMGVNFQTVAWSMFLYLVFNQMAFRRLPVEIQKDVQSGRVEVLFPRPVKYLYFKMGEYVGTRLTTFFLVGFLGTILMSIFIGIPNQILTMTFYMALPIVLVLSFILSFQINSIIGLLAFWFEDTSSIRWLADKTTMILGGAYFPVAFFPDILKVLSLYTPLGASQFVSYVALPTLEMTYLNMFSIQVFWIVVLGLFLVWMQSRAFGKLSVNGG
jgi:ABC-2 type transport system permease protein